MKSIYYLLILSLFQFGFTYVDAKDDIQIKTNIKSLELASSEGTEFFVAFPYNDNKQQQGQNLAIYVTSRVDNVVTLSNDALGLNIKKSVKANETVEFSTSTGLLDWDAEIFDFETVTNGGYKVTSESPVTVFCLNSKIVTSEGYMAIPTRSWGKEYIHNSFYDFKEAREWAGGFVVLAKEDSTRIVINIVDGANRARGFGETTGGKMHGDQIEVYLNEGETYAVQGTGTTRGIFDLSGTRVVSDKPIGLISYHNRAMIPATVVNNGRDHILEMIPAVEAWGKEYFSVELERNTDKGDYFRVVAAEDNTTLDIIWYDKKSKQKVNEFKSIELEKKGNWFEYNGEGATSPHELESIRGVAHFTADKPILVCQYSYSANYDGAAFMDPFMIVLTSVEQYTTYAYSTTPLNYGNNEYRENFVRIIVKADTIDPINNIRLLNSFKLNGVNLDYKNEYYNYGRIPNSEYYWISIFLDKAQTFNLESLVPFTASIYGFANFDSYGWPASSNAKRLNVTDSLSPGIVKMDNNDGYLFGVSDNPEGNRNGKEGDWPKQVDQGISQKPALSSSSYNFTAPIILDDKGREIEWNSENVYSNFQFKVDVDNKYENAMGIISVTDNGGNTSEINIYYEVDSLVVGLLNKEVLAERVNMTSEFNLKVENISESDVTINSISISDNSNFSLEGSLSLPMTIEKGKSLPLMMTFNPDKEGESAANVIVETDDLSWNYNLSGKGYVPTIHISNIDFGSINISEGNDTYKGNVMIKNSSATVDGAYSDITIRSVLVDPTSPNADQFTNFRIEGTNTPISEIDGLVLPVGESINVEFDLKADGTAGNKFARLSVISDAGPATGNGELPITENNIGYEFDGEFTVNNKSALDDGGYIQAELINKTQSSVENGVDYSSLQMKLLSSNPLDGESISLEIMNSNSSNVLITISDIKGNIISKLFDGKVTNNSTKEFSIKGMAAGVYFINATNGDSQVITKLIIEK